MRVTIFGSGYVGLVTAACFAERGNHVLCVDNDKAKVARLRRGHIPIHEPGLESLIKRNAKDGRHLNGYRVIVDRSTVPVGTADKVRGGRGFYEAGSHRDWCRPSGTGQVLA